MSIQHRYDSVIKDMLSVMQQALLRFITNRQVNASKFQQYFCNFFRRMISLQQQFHPQQTKFTQNLKKLWDLLKIQQTSQKFSLQPSINGLNIINKPMKNVQVSQNIRKPLTSQQSTKKPFYNQTLNIIGEEQQQFLQFERNNPRRSGTAQCKRSNKLQNSNSFKTNSRPKTGVYRSKDRYNNQTISYDSRKQNGKNNGKSLNLDQYQSDRDNRPPMKNFYKQLEQEAQAEIIYQNKIKIPKRNSISTHRWSFKINKLF